MCTYPPAQTLPCANTATCCANPQNQYNHPQLVFHKFAQLSFGTAGMCGTQQLLSTRAPVPRNATNEGKESQRSPRAAPCRQQPVPQP